MLQQQQQQQQQRSASDGSTWSNFFSKLGTLLPYMWPKKSLSLQVRVLGCLLILATVRVANVFVPIFSKKIGESERRKSICSFGAPVINFIEPYFQNNFINAPRKGPRVGWCKQQAEQPGRHEKKFHQFLNDNLRYQVILAMLRGHKSTEYFPLWYCNTQERFHSYF